MKTHTFYYGQIVTEANINDSFGWSQNAEKNLAKDISENGVFDGFVVSPTSPASTSVEVSQGVGRITDDGSRLYNSATQTVPCTVDEFGMPTFSDLLAGEGRWCSLYVKFKAVNSDLRTDGHGLPVWFTTSEGVEFYLHIALKGPAANKAILTRPGVLTTSVLLADIWFESGATTIIAGDIDLTRREDYYRQTVSGVEQVAGNPKDSLQILGSAISGISTNFLNADLPTGSADGAHSIGLGGTATEFEFLWADGVHYLNSGNTVHEAVAKIVSDLGRATTQGVAGSHLVAHGFSVNWYGPVPVSSGDNSIGGCLDGMVSDLAATAGNSGADLIGSRLVAGAPYALVAASVQTQLITLLGDLNNHVNTAGHASTAISCAATVATWADGTWLPSQTLLQRFESIVSTLALRPIGAGATGAGLIGCGLTSQSHSTETLIWPGNVSINDRFIDIASSVVHRVNVDGDSRLTGNFVPSANLAASLGAPTFQFSKIYTEGVNGGDLALTSPLYITSFYDLSMFAAAGCKVTMQLQGATDWVEYDGNHLAPADVASILDIGSNTNYWRNLYISGDIKIGTPVYHYSTVLGACGNWDDSNVANRMTIAANGENCTNGAIATRSYHRLDFLKDGMTVDQVEIEWFTAALANMTARILRLSFGALPALVATINPTAIGVKHITTQAVGFSGNTGNFTYMLEMQYNVAIGSRFYIARFRHTSSVLDY